jgi:phosphotriesterase-related protein
MQFGGHGYSHILLNVLPKMRIRGYTEQHINDMIINNPREWLTL